MQLDGGKWSKFIKHEIERVVNIYNADEVREIIYNVDKSFPHEFYEDYGLSELRKEFIACVIDKRIKNLTNI